MTTENTRARGPTWIQVMRAFFRLPGMRGFLLLLIAFGLVLLTSVILFDIRYAAPGGRRDIDTLEAIYAVFTLLFFGAAYEWPQDALTKSLFFIVPLMGMAVLGQTVLGLASAFLNKKRWEVAVASTFEHHVIVCGLGKIGLRVVLWLRDLGQDVVIIESDPNSPRLADVSSWRIPVIIGNASRVEVLQEANLNKASSIVPCTNDDLENLTIAVAARTERPDIRVVLRTFDENLALNLKKAFDIHYAYSTSALAAPAFAAAALQAPVDYAFAFGEDKMLLTVTEFVVVQGSRLAGMTVKELEEEFNVEILAIQNPETELNPPHDRVLSDGCHFVVSAPLEAMTQLAEATPSARELERYLKERRPAAS